MNLPNKLTVLRVIMVPFFVFFMLTDVGGPANQWIALVLFCVASLTDMLDGKIARKYNLVTSLPVSLLLADSALWLQIMELSSQQVTGVNLRQYPRCS